MLRTSFGWVLFLGAGIAAQGAGDRLFLFHGQSQGDNAGHAVAGLGDVNGDGYPDVALASPFAGGTGMVELRSGREGRRLHRMTGSAPGEQFGYCVAGCGDVDGDTTPDLLVGAPLASGVGYDAGAARLFSGKTGKLLFEWKGDSAHDRFGWSVGAAGDVDKDGTPDVVIGAIGDARGGRDAGSVFVFSGKTGSRLRVFSGDAPGDRMGASVAGADLNQDGWSDIVAGAWGVDTTKGPDAGMVRIWSGRDGSVMREHHGQDAGWLFGWSVATVGDANKDGHPDVLIGAWRDNKGPKRRTGTGSAWLYSGKEGNFLFFMCGEEEGDELGWSVSGAGDFNGDGYADVAVGARHEDEGGRVDTGTVRVFSGANGGLLAVFAGDSAHDRYGWAVAAAGDIDKDGFDDLIIGAPFDDDNGLEAGSTSIVLGAPPADEIREMFAEAPTDRFGEAVASAGDIDGDRIPDVIVGAYATAKLGRFTGTAYVFSGRTGKLLWRWDGRRGNSWFGRAVCGVSDVDRDGFDDVAVGAPYDDTFFISGGMVYVFSGKTGKVIRSYRGAGRDATLGVAVALAGDLNKDGWPDIVCGGNMANNYAGHAIVFSGKDSSTVLYRFDGVAGKKHGFGWRLDGAKDVDADGWDDVIVGSRGLIETGLARAYSGKTGKMIWEFKDTGAGTFFGSAVAILGDTNGDGHADLLVGASNDPTKFTSGGAAHVYSGKTGKELRVVYGEKFGSALGWAVGAAGDVNRDGFADILAGAPFEDRSTFQTAGAVYVFSGRDGALLHKSLGRVANDSFGMAVGLLGDVNGDSVPDLIAGAPRSLDGPLASVRVFTVPPATSLAPDSTTISLASGGTQTLRLDAGKAEAGKLYFLHASISGVHPGVAYPGGKTLPLNFDAWYFHTIAFANLVPFVNNAGFLDPQGRATAKFQARPGFPPDFLGLQVHQAFVVLAVPEFRVDFTSRPVLLTFAK